MDDLIRQMPAQPGGQPAGPIDLPTYAKMLQQSAGAGMNGGQAPPGLQ